MYAHIKHVLIEGFAKHLKIRDIQLDGEDASALTLLAKKYLALGVNVVPTQRVYDAISSDYLLLSMRTHYPSLGAYSEPTSAPVDPITFTEIIKQGFNPIGNKKQAHLIESSMEFNHFVDLITERAPDQESWVDVCRKDKWKDVALFLALNYKENPLFYKVLKTVSEKDDVSSLNKRMLAYKPKNMQALEKEMTSFIQSIALPAEFCDQVFSSLSSSSTKETQQEQVIIREEKSKNPIVKDQRDIIPNKVENLREQMEDYRKRAGLSPVVDTNRIAQQMVYACLGENIPPTLLTRAQKQLTPIQGDREAELVLDIIESDALDESALQSMLMTSQKAHNVMRVTNQYEWDARALLQHVIQPEKFLDERTLAKLNKL